MKTYQISVIAVYRDGIETKAKLQLRYSGAQIPNFVQEMNKISKPRIYYSYFTFKIFLTVVIFALNFILIWKPDYTRAVIYGINDTVLVREVRSTHLHQQVKVKLSGETDHSVHIYTTPCDKLLTHNSTVNYLVKMSLNHPDIAMLPTYLVNGSSIEVLLDASVIDVDISLYIFESLDEYSNYVSQLDRSIYQATVYTSRPGIQNTSTLVNYTVQSTDYYFVVIDSDAPVTAQFEITLHKELYHESDTKEACSVTGSGECSLSVSKHKCVSILARTHDLQWPPTYITVTVESYAFYFHVAILLCCFCWFKLNNCRRSPSQKYILQENEYVRDRVI